MNRPQVSPPILIAGAQSRDAANVGVMAASLPPLRVVVDPERLLDIADIDPARIGPARTALPADYFHCAVDLAVLAKQLHPQIGRASWRDSVCQNVEVSVE